MWKEVWSQEQTLIKYRSPTHMGFQMSPLITAPLGVVQTHEPGEPSFLCYAYASRSGEAELLVIGKNIAEDGMKISRSASR